MIPFNRLLHLFLLLLIAQLNVFAQEAPSVLTLEKAVATALANNLQVRQNGVQAQVAGVAYRQAKANLLPNVAATLEHGMNQGRSIDPFTNTYVNQEIMYGSYGVGASLLLFNGLNAQHTLKQTKLAHAATEMELQQARDNLVLSMYLAFLQVLNSADLVEVAKMQVAVTQEQLERLQLLNENGAISPPLIAELRGQLKQEELNIVTSTQALEVAKLTLAQLMNVPYREDIQLERLAAEELLLPAAEGLTPGVTYSAALEQLALVEAAEMRKRSAIAGIRARRGEFYPSLFVSYNLFSNYSSAARINGELIIYNEQVRNNLSSNIALTLRIPVLNAWQAHNGVRLAKLQLEEATIAEENIKLQLRQDVEQAHLNLNNALQRHELLQEQVASFEEAFRAAEIRFNAGLGTPVDYLIAKNNLDSARSELVRARYDYLLRLKVLDFYLGK